MKLLLKNVTYQIHYSVIIMGKFHPDHFYRHPKVILDPNYANECTQIDSEPVRVLEPTDASVIFSPVNVNSLYKTTYIPGTDKVDDSKSWTTRHTGAPVRGLNLSDLVASNPGMYKVTVNEETLTMSNATYKTPSSAKVEFPSSEVYFSLNINMKATCVKVSRFNRSEILCTDDEFDGEDGLGQEIFQNSYRYSQSAAIAHMVNTTLGLESVAGNTYTATVESNFCSNPRILIGAESGSGFVMTLIEVLKKSQVPLTDVLKNAAVDRHVILKASTGVMFDTDSQKYEVLPKRYNLDSYEWAVVTTNLEWIVDHIGAQMDLSSRMYDSRVYKYKELGNGKWGKYKVNQKEVAYNMFKKGWQRVVTSNDAINSHLEMCGFAYFLAGDRIIIKTGTTEPILYILDFEAFSAISYSVNCLTNCTLGLCDTSIHSGHPEYCKLIWEFAQEVYRCRCSNALAMPRVLKDLRAVIMGYIIRDYDGIESDTFLNGVLPNFMRNYKLHNLIEEMVVMKMHPSVFVELQSYGKLGAPIIINDIVGYDKTMRMKLAGTSRVNDSKELDSSKLLAAEISMLKLMIGGTLATLGSYPIMTRNGFEKDRPDLEIQEEHIRTYENLFRMQKPFSSLADMDPTGTISQSKAILCFDLDSPFNSPPVQSHFSLLQDKSTSLIRSEIFERHELKIKLRKSRGKKEKISRSDWERLNYYQIMSKEVMNGILPYRGTNDRDYDALYARIRKSIFDNDFKKFVEHYCQKVNTKEMELKRGGRGFVTGTPMLKRIFDMFRWMIRDILPLVPGQNLILDKSSKKRHLHSRQTFHLDQGYWVWAIALDFEKWCSNISTANSKPMTNILNKIYKTKAFSYMSEINEMILTYKYDKTDNLGAFKGTKSFYEGQRQNFGTVLTIAYLYAFFEERSMSAYPDASGDDVFLTVVAGPREMYNKDTPEGRKHMRKVMDDLVMRLTKWLEDVNFYTDPAQTACLLKVSMMLKEDSIGTYPLPRGLRSMRKMTGKTSIGLLNMDIELEKQKTNINQSLETSPYLQVPYLVVCLRTRALFERLTGETLSTVEFAIMCMCGTSLGPISSLTPIPVLVRTGRDSFCDAIADLYMLGTKFEEYYPIVERFVDSIYDKKKSLDAAAVHRHNVVVAGFPSGFSMPTRQLFEELSNRRVLITNELLKAVRPGLSSYILECFKKADVLDLRILNRVNECLAENVITGLIDKVETYGTLNAMMILLTRSVAHVEGERQHFLRVDTKIYIPRMERLLNNRLEGLTETDHLMKKEVEHRRITCRCHNTHDVGLITLLTSLNSAMLFLDRCRGAYPRGTFRMFEMLNQCKSVKKTVDKFRAGLLGDHVAGHTGLALRSILTPDGCIPKDVLIDPDHYLTASRDAAPLINETGIPDVRCLSQAKQTKMGSATKVRSSTSIKTTKNTLAVTIIRKIILLYFDIGANRRIFFPLLEDICACYTDIPLMELIQTSGAHGMDVMRNVLVATPKDLEATISPNIGVIKVLKFKLSNLAVSLDAEIFTSFNRSLGWLMALIFELFFLDDPMALATYIQQIPRRYFIRTEETIGLEKVMTKFSYHRHPAVTKRVLRALRKIEMNVDPDIKGYIILDSIGQNGFQSEGVIVEAKNMKGQLMKNLRRFERPTTNLIRAFCVSILMSLSNQVVAKEKLAGGLSLKHRGGSHGYQFLVRNIPADELVAHCLNIREICQYVFYPVLLRSTIDDITHGQDEGEFCAGVPMRDLALALSKNLGSFVNNNSLNIDLATYVTSLVGGDPMPIPRSIQECADLIFDYIKYLLHDCRRLSKDNVIPKEAYLIGMPNNANDYFCAQALVVQFFSIVYRHSVRTSFRFNNFHNDFEIIDTLKKGNEEHCKQFLGYLVFMVLSRVKISVMAIYAQLVCKSHFCNMMYLLVYNEFEILMPITNSLNVSNISSMLETFDSSGNAQWMDKVGLYPNIKSLSTSKSRWCVLLLSHVPPPVLAKCWKELISKFYPTGDKLVITMDKDQIRRILYASDINKCRGLKPSKSPFKGIADIQRKSSYFGNEKRVLADMYKVMIYGKKNRNSLDTTEEELDEFERQDKYDLGKHDHLGKISIRGDVESVFEVTQRDPNKLRRNQYNKYHINISTLGSNLLLIKFLTMTHGGRVDRYLRTKFRSIDRIIKTGCEFPQIQKVVISCREQAGFANRLVMNLPEHLILHAQTKLCTSSTPIELISLPSPHRLLQKNVYQLTSPPFKKGSQADNLASFTRHHGPYAFRNQPSVFLDLTVHTSNLNTVHDNDAGQVIVQQFIALGCFLANSPLTIILIDTCSDTTTLLLSYLLRCTHATTVAGTILDELSSRTVTIFTSRGFSSVKYQYYMETLYALNRKMIGFEGFYDPLLTVTPKCYCLLKQKEDLILFQINEAKKFEESLIIAEPRIVQGWWVHGQSWNLKGYRDRCSGLNSIEYQMIKRTFDTFAWSASKLSNILNICGKYWPRGNIFIAAYLFPSKGRQTIIEKRIEIFERVSQTYNKSVRPFVIDDNKIKDSGIAKTALHRWIKTSITALSALPVFLTFPFDRDFSKLESLDLAQLTSCAIVNYYGSFCEMMRSATGTEVSIMNIQAHLRTPKVNVLSQVFPLNDIHKKVEQICLLVPYILKVRNFMNDGSVRNCRGICLEMLDRMY